MPLCLTVGRMKNDARSGSDRMQCYRQRQKKKKTIGSFEAMCVRKNRNRRPTACCLDGQKKKTIGKNTIVTKGHVCSQRVTFSKNFPDIQSLILYLKMSYRLIIHTSKLLNYYWNDRTRARTIILISSPWYYTWAIGLFYIHRNYWTIYWNDSTRVRILSFQYPAPDIILKNELPA